MNEIKITCKSQKTMPLEELLDFQGNLKTLSPESESKIRQSILKHGFSFPVFVWGSHILDGHQRIFTLKKMIQEGYTIGPIPVDEIEAKDEKDAAEKLLALNSHHGRITEDGLMDFVHKFEIDLSALSEIDLPDIDLSALIGNPMGMPDDEPGGNSGDDDTYTRKIVAPIYEPKGEKPSIGMMIDRTKTNELIEGINKANLQNDVADFMRHAAERHTIFHFRHIAEFYCHADPALQDLMERSGMVIIDFKKAIEYGFVHMTERLGELADLEGADNDDA